LKVYADFGLKTHKTKDFLKAIESLIESKKEKTVIITAQYDSNMVLASRNLKGIKVLNVSSLDLLPIIYADRVLVSENAMEKLGEILTRNKE
jgi:large subunit ribosomal protein L4